MLYLYYNISINLVSCYSTESGLLGCIGPHNGQGNIGSSSKAGGSRPVPSSRQEISGFKGIMPTPWILGIERVAFVIPLVMY